MRSVEDLLRLAADSNECSVFDDKLAQIVEENSCGLLEDDLLENVAGGTGERDEVTKSFEAFFKDDK